MIATPYLDMAKMAPGYDQMRVAIVSDAGAERNGVGTYYEDLRQHLEHYVNKIDLLCPQIEHGEWQGGWAIPMPGDATQRVVIPYFHTLKNQLDAVQPDVVIVATPGLYGQFGAFYGRFIGARVLVGFHTWLEKLTEMYWNKIQGTVAKNTVMLSNKLLFKMADCVLTTSTHMVEIAHDMGAEKVEIIATPVGYEFIYQEPPPPAETIKTVLFAGRWVAEKNIGAILEAAEKLPHLTFRLAGDGPERVKIDAAARRLPNVESLGWLDRSQLRHTIDQHDLIVLPSHVESFGTIALEGMARQRTVVVSAACGITEWPELVDGLFQIRPGESVAQALDRITRLPFEERAAVSAAGRAKAVTLNDTNCQQWLNLLQPTNHLTNQPSI